MFWDSSVNRPREMWLPQLLPSPDEGAAGVRAQLARGGCRRGRGERRGMKGGCLRFGEKTKRMGRLPWPPPEAVPLPHTRQGGRRARRRREAILFREGKQDSTKPAKTRCPLRPHVEAIFRAGTLSRTPAAFTGSNC